MKDHQNTSMRALLSHAAPAHDEEPPARDVIGPAIAWGDRRRRLDRVMVATGAALAVVAVGTGVATLGNGARHGAAIGPAGPGRSYATSAGAAGSCTLPNGAPGSPTFCGLDQSLRQFGTQFADGAAGYIAAKLPSGVVAGRTTSYYLKLTKGGTTEYLYPSVTSPDSLVGGKERCGNAECHLITVANGTAAVVTDGGAIFVDWAPTADDGPRIAMALTSVGSSLEYVYPPIQPPGSPVVPQTGGSSAKPVTLLTPQQIADIIGDPAFRQYAYQMYNRQLALIQQYQAQMASELPSIPGGYVSGSIPASGIGGVPNPSAPSAPSGTPSGLVSPPSVPLGTSSSQGGMVAPPTFLPPTCWLDAHGQCGPSPTGGSAPATPIS